MVTAVITVLQSQNKQTVTKKAQKASIPLKNTFIVSRVWRTKM